MSLPRASLWVLAFIAFAAAITSFAADSAGPGAPPNLERGRRITGDKAFDPDKRNITQISVRLKTSAQGDEERELRPEEIQRIASAAGVPLSYRGLLSGGALHWFDLRVPISHREGEPIVARIQALPEVQFAVAAGGNFGLNYAPSDPLFLPRQWNLQDSTGGIRADRAWDLFSGDPPAVGDPEVIVSVIDGGVLFAHEELAGRLVAVNPAGYDFISNATVANDGDGRDGNPADPGDWVSQADLKANPTLFANCIPKDETKLDSTWHGTSVVSVLGAGTNNAKGIAGVDWRARILPVRAFGKCRTGARADVLAAVNWSAGRSVTGVPANVHKVRVINLSFAREAAACASDFQDAVDAAYKKRIVTIVAVGNEAADAGLREPVNCKRVIAVAATTRQGTLASYSNRGGAVTLSAPGGDDRFNNEFDELTMASDGGTQAPLNDNGYRINNGTSFAAPQVAGVVSLMFAVQPRLRMENVKSILQNTANPFPTGTAADCTTALCGTGILNAERAVRAAKSVQAGGTYHSMAIQSDGTVVTWGFNGNGQLGGGEGFGLLRAAPGTPIPGLTGVRNGAVSSYHNVVAKADGTVWAWGYNAYGQLGNNTFEDSNVPAQVAGLSNVISVAAGDQHSLALKADGTVWAWGYGFFGQLGAAPYTFDDSPFPVQVGGLSDVVAIHAAGKNSFAIKSDGTVWQWGATALVGPGGSASISSTPVQLPGLADISLVSGGGVAELGYDDFAIARTWDGQLYVWGPSDWGQFGDDAYVGTFQPTAGPTLPAPVISLAASRNHVLVTLDDGTLWSWGLGSSGQLADGTSGTLPGSPVPYHRKTPQQAATGLTKLIDLAVGSDHSMAFSGDLTLASWGSNLGGQLGDGTPLDSAYPLQVVAPGGTGVYTSGSTSGASTDLAVALSAPSTVTAGQSFAYDFTVSNTGDASATGVVLSVAVSSQLLLVSAPPGCNFEAATLVCAIGTLAAGASTPLQAVFNPLASGQFDASATVISTIFDPNDGNNTSGSTTLVASTGAVVPMPPWALALLAVALVLAARRAWRSGQSATA